MEALLERSLPLGFRGAPATWGFILGISSTMVSVVAWTILNRRERAGKNEPVQHDDDESDEEQEQGLSPEVLQAKPQDWDISRGPFKMVLCVNQELYESSGKATKMKPGKTAAQCCHAVLGGYKRALKRSPRAVAGWEKTGVMKVTLKVPTEERLMKIREGAASAGIAHYLVEDAGRTQIAPGSKTVLCLGPAPLDVLDLLTGELKLY
uniref:peptidyl-tRNA hydrolase n=2 Tax=Octactis speculum TaxID=3111310 RepID=A0A7S2DCF3_9STRA|eukprot:CAMPEP_0185775292 /NCGR_PEP_ID=MMETSP1174-20130828/81541_1 /TAXON_ID=35687 /ORGANISM="Dictyocha speculum, Strain CCMP1381" /LENGTH=207 /DNA_ID=CAMNT_0028462815 /DNA_START=24 /DNA_END=647 /DNA_ORIENTATION=+